MKPKIFSIKRKKLHKNINKLFINWSIMLSKAMAYIIMITVNYQDS